MKKLKIILQSNIFLILVILSLFLAFYRANQDLKVYYNLTDTNIQGKIITIVKKEDKLSFIIKGKEKVQVNYYGEEKYDVELGDFVALSGQLKIPSNNTVPNNFNYKNYLKHKGINYTMTVDKIKIIKKNTNVLYKIKNNLKRRIDKFTYSDYLYTFILGDKNYLDESVYESYRNNGVVHLFCISGTHISLLTGLLLYLFRKIKISYVKSYLMIFIFLFFYMFLTSFGASVLRSSLFFILIGLKKINLYNFSTKEIFYLTIILLFLISPNLLYDIGFLYSAIITWGLIISGRIIKGNYIKKVLIISFLSTLFSLPITVNNFYEINVMGIFYNIIFVPIVSFILTPLTFLTVIFAFLEPILGIIIKFLEFLSIHFNIFSLKLVIPKFPFLFILIYYFLLYKFVTSKNKYIFSLLGLIIFLKLLTLIDSNTYVYFLDVNQGDSSLMKYKNKLILIDTGGVVSFTGESDYLVSDKTINLVKSLGFSHIDYLILTHGDYDHMGEAENIINNLKVKRVIFNCDEFNDLELELIKLLKRERINFSKGANQIKLGKSKLQFLTTRIYDNENDNSNVIYANIKGNKFLLMGDAGIEKEADILNKYNISNITFLKVGHHGSDTSSSKEFINSLMPHYSIISVGKKNRYGHPKEEVLKTLASSKIYRTDIKGSVEVILTGNKYIIKNYAP